MAFELNRESAARLLEHFEGRRERIVALTRALVEAEFDVRESARRMAALLRGSATDP